MKNRHREEGVNLSFLDVMACGLGAVIMILIIVKFFEKTDLPNDEVARLQQELLALQTRSSQLDDELFQSQQQRQDQQDIDSLVQARIRQLLSTESDLQLQLSQQKTRVAQLEEELAVVSARAPDPIATPDVKEQTYLLGLKVEGSRIGMLIDSSASMSDEALINVISRKLGSDEEKRAGPKWRRTLAITRWLLARLPDSAQFSVVTFNKDARHLGQSPVMLANDPQALASVLTALDATVPQHGTNLLTALKTIRQTMPNMTDLYVVTDGLPTLIEKDTNFTKSRSCRPEPGQQATIDGECRMRVFAHSLRFIALPTTQVNVVLLPLEGDSAAPAAYWSWTRQSNGTFIAPAANWP